jgi:hypothetical protein
MRIVFFIFFYFLIHFSINAKNVKYSSVSINNTLQSKFNCDNYFENFYFEDIDEDNLNSNYKINIKTFHYYFIYSFLKPYKTIPTTKFNYCKDNPKSKLFKICVLRI